MIFCPEQKYDTGTQNLIKGSMLIRDDVYALF
jgi:hypothetical protein